MNYTFTEKKYVKQCFGIYSELSGVEGASDLSDVLWIWGVRQGK